MPTFTQYETQLSEFLAPKTIQTRAKTILMLYLDHFTAAQAASLILTMFVTAQPA